MKPIEINIKEAHGIGRNAEPITIGIPFKKGELYKLEQLCLYHLDDIIPCQVSSTANWHDTSVKWILLKFQIDLTAQSEKTLTLALNELEYLNLAQEITNSKQISIEDLGNKLTINTGQTTFVLNKNELKPIEQIIQNKKIILDNQQNFIILKDQQSNILKPLIKSVNFEHNKNDICSTITLKGHFASNVEQVCVFFSTNLTFYAGKSTIKWDFTIHNPKSAQHKAGLWDLGDEASFYFKELSSQFLMVSDSIVSWKEDTLSQWKKSSDKQLLIYQDSSGGVNWDSINHLNSQGNISLQTKGYQCIENDKLIHHADRASPFIHIKSKNYQFSAYIKQFWQNFPKAIEIKNQHLSLSLFPQQYNDGFELQPGERKTHSLYLDFSDDKNALAYCQYPLIATLNISYYAQSHVLPWLPKTFKANQLDDLIHEGIEGDDSFFVKREIIDEYGWRNFGDLFADHESLYNTKNQLNISHYNNQYDPIYGFARQFILSGDQRWFELMSDLAQHVADIDIYHTTDDRHEYNGGLFWHTNHYVKAATCTHRTFSIQHKQDDPQTGGGPGSEHCYTSGLATHYFLTGEKQSKQAVLSLANWMMNVFEGNGGFFERILQFKQKEMPILKRLIKGEKVAKFKYPLTRGTGNYINTLLDAYYLTADDDFISRIEQLIQYSIHPHDDIESRNLHDIEVSWSYTILLQSVTKYLMLKISREENDEAFKYAKNSFMHYAHWMLMNEYPYLEKPEVLEFPNHTWVAQDIRKAYLLSIAANFSSQKQQQYKDKANYFLDYVINNLKNNETRTFTRILAVLMQNHLDFNHEVDHKSCYYEEQKYPDKCPNYTMTGILVDSSVDMIKRLFKLSIKNEKKWLKLRLSK